jgi:hypothetical protein
VPVLGTPNKDGGDPKHVSYVDITVNASTEAVRVEYAITETTTVVRPIDTSASWTYLTTVKATGRVYHPHTPSGKRVWWRARSVPDSTDTGLKLPSVWAYGGGVGYVDMTAISAPSMTAPSGVTASSAQINMTPGDYAYPIQVMIGLGTVAVASFTNDDAVEVLPAGSVAHTLHGLDGPSIQHTVCIRHIDRFGGYSAGTREVFSTTTTVPTAPRPAGIAPAIVSSIPEVAA